MWAGLDEEGHVGSIDMLENIVGFEVLVLLVLNFIFVMKMMPPTTKCVCGKVWTRRDMSDQLTRSIRLMQSNQANWGAFYSVKFKLQQKSP